MIAALIDHLWQSTLFALGAGSLTLALKANGARFRYGLWFAASVKFLIPFALLATAGGWIVTRLHPLATAPAGLQVVRRVVEPFASGPIAPSIAPMLAPPPSVSAVDHAAFHLPVLAILLTVWALGAAAVLTLWVLRWSRVRAALLASSPLALATTAPARSSPSLLEPGVVGVFRQVLMFPRGIEAHLSPAELDAVLAHELCHLRRRDNLTAAIHMLVEALFWFHPMVWWIGGRLIAERERACDEGVIAAGNDPRLYAESILKVCRFYLQLPLACAAGVSGSNLKKRMETIMTGSPGAPLGVRKTLLVSTAAVLAVAAPLAAGLIAALPAQARTVILEKAGIQAPAPAPTAAAETSTAPGPAPSQAPERSFAQTLEQDAKTLAAPGEALAAAVAIEPPSAPSLQLASVTAAPAPVNAAEPAAESTQGAALPAPPASCRLSTLATFHLDPHSDVPLIGGQINGHKVEFIAAVSSESAVFRSAAQALENEHPRVRYRLVPGGMTSIGYGWVDDLELDDMPGKSLSSYAVHKDFGIPIVDGGEGWLSNPSAVLGWRFWSLADDDFDLRSGSISLVRPAGCARADTLPFNGGAYSETRILVGATDTVERRVTVLVDGVPLEAVLDPTVASSLMTGQGAVKLGRGWPLPGAQPQGQLATTAGGKIPWAKARFKTFSIGQETIRNPNIAVADLYNHPYGEIKELWMYGRAPRPSRVPVPNIVLPDLILGADFFHAHHLLISNSRRMVYFVYNGAPIFQ